MQFLANHRRYFAEVMQIIIFSASGQISFLALTVSQGLVTFHHWRTQAEYCHHKCSDRELLAACLMPWKFPADKTHPESSLV